MTAMRNLLHGVALALWAVMGLVFTAKSLFGGPIMNGLFTAGTWWLWFAGFAALTTIVVRSFEKAVAPLLVHGAALIVLMAIPKIFPLNLLRLGVDLLDRAA